MDNDGYAQENFYKSENSGLYLSKSLMEPFHDFINKEGKTKEQRAALEVSLLDILFFDSDDEAISGKTDIVSETDKDDKDKKDIGTGTDESGGEKEDIGTETDEDDEGTIKDKETIKDEEKGIITDKEDKGDKYLLQIIEELKKLNETQNLQRLENEKIRNEFLKIIETHKNDILNILQNSQKRDDQHLNDIIRENDKHRDELIKENDKHRDDILNIIKGIGENNKPDEMIKDILNLISENFNKMLDILRQSKTSESDIILNINRENEKHRDAILKIITDMEQKIKDDNEKKNSDILNQLKEQISKLSDLKFGENISEKLDEVIGEIRRGKETFKEMIGEISDIKNHLGSILDNLRKEKNNNNKTDKMEEPKNDSGEKITATGVTGGIHVSVNLGDLGKRIEELVSKQGDIVKTERTIDEELRKKSQELADCIKSKANEVKPLTEKIGDLESQIREAELAESKKTTEVEGQITALEQKLKEFESTKATKVQDQITVLEKQLKEAELTKATEVKSLNDQIDDLKLQVKKAESLTNQIAALESQLEKDKSTKPEEVEYLTKQITALQSKLEEANSTKPEEVQYLNTLITALQSQLEEAKSEKSKEVESLNTQIADLQTQLKDANSTKPEVESLNTRITTLQSQLEKDKSEKSKEVESLTKQITALQTQLKDAKSEKSKEVEYLTKQIQTLNDQIKNSIEFKKKILIDNSKLSEQHTQAINSKDTEILQIKKEISSLKSQLDESRKLKIEVDSELEKARRELSGFKNELLQIFQTIFSKETTDINGENVIEQITEKLEYYSNLDQKFKEVNKIYDTLRLNSDNNNVFKYSDILEIPGEDNAFINIPNIPDVSEFKKEFQNYMKNFKKIDINSIIINNNNKNLEVNFDQIIIKNNYIILIKYLILMFRFYSRDPLFMRYQSIIGHEKIHKGGDIFKYVVSMNVNISTSKFKQLYKPENSEIKTKINDKNQDLVYNNFKNDITNYINDWQQTGSFSEKEAGFIKKTGIFESIRNEIIPNLIKYETFKEIIGNLYYLTIEQVNYQVISEQLIKLKIIKEDDERFKKQNGNYNISTEIFLNDIMLTIFTTKTNKLQEYESILRILLQYNSNLFNNLNVLHKIKEHSNKLDEIGKTHLSHNDKVQTILRIRGDGSGSANCRFNIKDEDSINENTDTIELTYSAINKKVYNFKDDGIFDEATYYTGDQKNASVPQQTIICGPYNQIYTKSQTNQNIVKSDYLQSIIKDIDKGTIFCFLAYAASGAGKSFTFFGDSNTNQPGIAILICNQLMTSYETLEIDMFEIGAFSAEKSSKLTTNLVKKTFKKTKKDSDADNKEFVWTLEEKKIQSETKTRKVTEDDSKKSMTLNEFLIKTTAERKTFPTPNNKESSRTHLCIIFNFSGKMFVVFDFAGVEGSFDCNSENLLKKFKEYYPNDISKFEDINSEEKIKKIFDDEQLKKGDDSDLKLEKEIKTKDEIILQIQIFLKSYDMNDAKKKCILDFIKENNEKVKNISEKKIPIEDEDMDEETLNIFQFIDTSIIKNSKNLNSFEGNSDTFYKIKILNGMYESELKKELQSYKKNSGGFDIQDIGLVLGKISSETTIPELIKKKLNDKFTSLSLTSPFKHDGVYLQDIFLIRQVYRENKLKNEIINKQKQIQTNNETREESFEDSKNRIKDELDKKKKKR